MVVAGIDNLSFNTDTWLLAWTLYAIVVFLSVWSTDSVHQVYQKYVLKCRVLGLIPGDLIRTFDGGAHELAFKQAPCWLWWIPKLEACGPAKDPSQRSWISSLHRWRIFDIYTLTFVAENRNDDNSYLKEVWGSGELYVN